MRVMTFNIQHCHDWQNNKINIPLFSETIDRFSPDICGLNEVRGRGALKGYSDQLRKIAEPIGYNRYFGQTIKVGGVGPYGNGLVAKYDIVSAEVIHIPDTTDRNGRSNFEHRGIIRATVDACGNDLTVLVCHMGLSEPEQKNAVESLCDIIDETDTPLIVMGDFNTSPSHDVLLPLVERLNDTDKVSENSGTYTFPSYAPEVKIDYIFYRGLRCTYAETVTEIISDHYPIIADFEFC